MNIMMQFEGATVVFVSYSISPFVLDTQRV